MRVRVMLMVAGVLAVPAVAHAQDAPRPTTAPPAPIDESGGVTGDVEAPVPVTLPLVPVPEGCAAPALPHIVFVGKVVDRDYRTVRFEIEQIRAGRPDPFASGDRIDVRYGLDAQYLDDGERYLVGAPVDPVLGLLVSRVTEPVEDFGGDEVIGVSESDVSCPEFENPTRTLHTDGTPVDASLLEPFWSAKTRLLASILVPLGVGVGIVFVLAMLRLSVSGLFRSIADVGRRRAGA